MGEMTSLNTVNSQLKFKLDSLNAEAGKGQRQALDSAAMMKELLIYPGQVSRILYSTAGPTQVYLDSLSQGQGDSIRAKTLASAQDSSMMTREEFDEQMEKFRSEMLQAQATRDSAMMMAFASRIPEQQEYEPVETEPQELVVNTEGVDDDTAKKIQKNNEKQAKVEMRNAKKQAKLEDKNNKLLKGALLVGGTAAATAAISNSGDKKQAAAQAQRDSVLMAQIQADSVMIDSLQRQLQAGVAPVAADTVVVEKTIPATSHALLNQSKVEIFFGVNETALTEAEKQKLQLVKKVLDDNAELGLELIGYADNTGTVSYNLKISEKRVAAVSDYFVSLGIDSSRISSDVGGLIIRGSRGSMDSDRKVEVRFKEQ